MRLFDKVKLQEEEILWLKGKGYSGTYNDMMYAYLKSLPRSGAYNDMLRGLDRAEDNDDLIIPSHPVNLLTNPDFLDQGGWVVAGDSTGWTVPGTGQAVLTGAQTGVSRMLQQVLEVGVEYRIVVEVLSITGLIRISLGNSFSEVFSPRLGVTEYVGTCQGNTSLLVYGYVGSLAVINRLEVYRT